MQWVGGMEVERDKYVKMIGFLFGDQQIEG